MTKTFSELGLNDALQKALRDQNYTTPTPIQTAAIPHLLEGRDLLGCAQTGTGKTAAFALPILHNLGLAWDTKLTPKQTRVLVLTPTRELAIQIEENFRAYGKYMNLKHAVIFGGVGQTPQVKALSRGVDVLIATPGRLLDLIQQKYLSLSGVEVFVLDEADRMLDMGFVHDINKVLKLLPHARQNLFFSATMPPDIVKLSNTILKNPIKVEITPPATTVELIQQSVMYVDRKHKSDLLRHLLKDNTLDRVIVFTRTKHGANRVVEVLEKNRIPSAAIHGNKSQGARQKALENFRAGKVRVLVATDIAARGIDIDDISHVINYEVPNISESYVHRIGRTARAGTSGIAISFCDAEEKAFIRDIEKLIAQPIPVDTKHPYHSAEIAEARTMSSGKAKAAIEGNRGGGRGRRPPGRRFGGGGRGGPSGGGGRNPSSRGSRDARS